MFTDFFYLLRAKGLKVTPREWHDFMEGLDKGLHESTLTGFYYLARGLLVKTEADFDKFDQAFVDYFRYMHINSTLPPQLLEWLENPQAELEEEQTRSSQRSIMEIQSMFQQRLKEQTERHDGGSYWIGTGGSSHFGNSGHLSRGIRVGGDTRNLTALQIAGNREYKDFRDDEVLDIRQFQMAFRRLRQFSTQEDGAKDELQLEESIQKTCDNAGYLQLVFDRPRRNSVKVMLLFDSGGSMWRFTKLCSTLFQAATKANRFKDLKIYYFHNCFHDNLYNSPRLGSEYAIKTEWVMHNLRDYKVIVIGDAAMDPDDLESPQAYAVGDAIYEATGIDWLRYFHSRYKKMVWLNPTPKNNWNAGHGGESISIIRSLIPMYPLTVKGLEEAMKYLVSDRKKEKREQEYILY